MDTKKLENGAQGCAFTGLPSSPLQAEYWSFLFWFTFAFICRPVIHLVTRRCATTFDADVIDCSFYEVCRIDTRSV